MPIPGRFAANGFEHLSLVDDLSTQEIATLKVELRRCLSRKHNYNVATSIEMVKTYFYRLRWDIRLLPFLTVKRVFIHRCTRPASGRLGGQGNHITASWQDLIVQPYDASQQNEWVHTKASIYDSAVFRIDSAKISLSFFIAHTWTAPHEDHNFYFLRLDIQ